MTRLLALSLDSAVTPSTRGRRARKVPTVQGRGITCTVGHMDRFYTGIVDTSNCPLLIVSNTTSHPGLLAIASSSTFAFGVLPVNG